jgi:hypothetical protein
MDRPSKRRKAAHSRDSFQLDGLVDQVMEIDDINADPNSESSKSQDQSARKQFMSFLNIEETFENLTVVVDKVTIGKFCTYMLSNPDIGFQTSMNYLSSIRRQLEQQHNVEFFKEDQNWYRDTRKNLTRSYVEASLRGKYSCLNKMTY